MKTIVLQILMDKIMGLLRPTEKQPVSKGQFFHLNHCIVDLFI